MMKSKKGVEMALQTMVVAALVLIILIVLIFLFTRQSGIFDDSINACQDRGEEYRCMSSCSGDYDFYSAGGCGENQVCCVQADNLFGE